MKILLYSCVSGDYDNKLSDRLYVSPSDNFTTHRMNAKFPKILPHKIKELQYADYTVWADSNLKFHIDPLTFIEYFDYPKVGVFAHIRPDINDEIRACKLLKLDYPLKLDYHKDRIGKLACCFLIVRKNCEEVNILNERWWAEICAGSSRDQVSFPYTLGQIATYKDLPSHNFEHNNMWTRLKHKTTNQIINC
jgi:hypothetical protein